MILKNKDLCAVLRWLRIKEAKRHHKSQKSRGFLLFKRSKKDSLEEFECGVRGCAKPFDIVSNALI